MHDRSRRVVQATGVVLLAAVALAPSACCCPGGAPARQAVAAPEPPAPLPIPEAITRGASAGAPTQTLMRNVRFHLQGDIAVRLQTLRGAMHSVREDAPITFGDPSSFRIELAYAAVAMRGPELADLLNRHIFAYDGAPLRDLSIRIADGRLVQRGVMHKGIDIPFEMTAEVTATPDGLLRLHPVGMEICGLNGGALLDALGITLDDLLDLARAEGVRVRGDDLLIDPSVALPPPELQGRLRSAQLVGDELLLEFGPADTTMRVADLTPPEDADNFMYFRGGTLRFGKLFMAAADMQIVDLDPSDIFDFSLPRYERQLVAGYSRVLADDGLLVFMPDLNDIGEEQLAATELQR